MSVVRCCVFSAIVWLICITEAAACSCLKSSFEQLFLGSTLVFEGIAINTRTIKPDTSGGHFQSLHDLITTFKVTRAIKGTGFETREIRHHIESSSCGIGFKIGVKYQVYADGMPGSYSTDWCTFTGHLIRKRHMRWLMARKPAPEQSIRGILDQIYDSNLTKADAELLIYEYEERQEDNHITEFIRDYIHRTKLAEELAAAGNVRDYLGALVTAQYYKMWGDFERVADMFRLVEQAAPMDALGAAERGRALYMAGHARQAIPHLERALRLDPDHPDIATYLARARLRALSKLTAGITDYREIRAAKLNLDKARHANISLSGAVIGILSARNAKMPGIRLNGAKIIAAEFPNANLEGAFFSSTGISRGDFSNANLSGADMAGSGFLGASFKGADLTRIRAHRSDFDRADLRNTQLWKANFTKSNLHKVLLEETNFKNADFTNASLANAYLRGADLRDAILVKTDFLGARIDCATRLPKNFNANRAGMVPVVATCNGIKQNRDFSNRNWKNTDFADLDLSGASFTNSKFDVNRGYDQSFTGANLQDADLSNSSGQADFSGADLSRADFSNATVHSAFYALDTKGGHSRARFPANLMQTNFSGAELDTGYFMIEREYGGDASSRSPNADYTKARFDNAQIKCSYSDFAQHVELYAKEPIKPIDPSTLLWDESSEIERRRALDYAKTWHIEEAARRKQQAMLVQDERAMIAFLQKNWPTVVFDESCKVYLTQRSENDPQ